MGNPTHIGLLGALAMGLQASARVEPTQHHIYVMYLGVEKAWHGYGAAPALVDRLREHADGRAAGSYGNCHKRPLPFGAEAFAEGALAGTTASAAGGPAFYFLYREPVSQPVVSTAVRYRGRC